MLIIVPSFQVEHLLHFQHMFYDVVNRVFHLHPGIPVEFVQALFQSSLYTYLDTLFHMNGKSCMNYFLDCGLVNNPLTTGTWLCQCRVALGIESENVECVRLVPIFNFKKRGNFGVKKSTIFSSNCLRSASLEGMRLDIAVPSNTKDSPPFIFYNGCNIVLGHTTLSPGNNSQRERILEIAASGTS